MDIFTIKPMKPKKIGQIPSDNDNFIYECKYDGGGGLIQVDKGKAIIWHIGTHGVYEVKRTYRYPLLAKEIQINIKDGLYHCELCVFDHLGFSHHALFQKRQCEKQFVIDIKAKTFPVVAMIHDILFDGEQDVRGMALMGRKKLLIDNVTEGNHIQLVKPYRTADELLAQREYIEGIVIKDIDSPYLSGKRQGFKYRFNKEKTVKVTSFEEHQNGNGIILITHDNKRVNLAGNRVEPTRQLLADGNEINVEISYYEETNNGYRFPVVKRVIAQGEGRND